MLLLSSEPVSATVVVTLSAPNTFCCALMLGSSCGVASEAEAATETVVPVSVSFRLSALSVCQAPLPLLLRASA